MDYFNLSQSIGIDTLINKKLLAANDIFKFVRNGDIVIARIEDEVTVKYFRKPADDMVILEPANDDFNDIEINLRNEDFFIEGKYVGLIREN